MNWIRVDVALSGHPKVARLAAMLAQPLADAHLVRLWTWAAKYAREGNLDGCDAFEIAIACGWPGDAQRLLDALIACRFIDRRPAGGLELHDWWEHQGAAIEKAARDAEKKRLDRLKKADAARRRADEEAERRAPNDEWRADGARQMTNGAGTNGRTDETDGRTDGHTAGAGAREAPSSGGIPPPAEPPEPVEGDEWERFWAAWPRQQREAPAQRAFLLAAGRRPPIDELVAIVEAWSASAEWRREAGRFVPLAERWLNEGRWREPAPRPAPQTLTPHPPPPPSAEELFARRRIATVAELVGDFAHVLPDEQLGQLRDVLGAAESEEDLATAERLWRRIGASAVAASRRPPPLAAVMPLPSREETAAMSRAARSEVAASG